MRRSRVFRAVALTALAIAPAAIAAPALAHDGRPAHKAHEAHHPANHTSWHKGRSHGNDGNGGPQDQGDLAHLPGTYTLPGNALFPEGLGYDAQTATYYTGSLIDGTIVRGSIFSPAASVFSPAGADGRTSVLGMRTDSRYLYVAGGASGTLFIYDKRSARFVGKASDGLAAGKTLLNDIAVTPTGIYVTDTTAPVLWRLDRGPNTTWTLDRFIDFTGTAFTYQPSGNADGIAATPDGKTLIIGSIGTGALYKVDVASKAVTQINDGNYDLTNADGISLVDDDLYVARNRNNQIVKLDLSPDFATASVDTITTSPRFDFTVGIAPIPGYRLLVLNSQFEHSSLFGGTPTPPNLPFTIAQIKLP
jgi:sugar lactone lactonase YvrE